MCQSGKRVQRDLWAALCVDTQLRPTAINNCSRARCGDERALPNCCSYVCSFATFEPVDSGTAASVVSPAAPPPRRRPPAPAPTNRKLYLQGFGHKSFSRLYVSESNPAGHAQILTSAPLL
ncbi:hypothetical protein EVAR_2300_1 [Eumeta japonica]|uniref:Uncharacterized protein n=1 Tax=Eumeta variegata TaxID=151549 RepID=A0A4C1SFX0_EUMVA|nr:hypothetical protein EVAR_2300_1 [Eumeta japonica]